MARSKFDYRGAKEAGYSDEEILSHLSEIYSEFDVENALNSGYSPQEINEHLLSYKPKRSKIEQGSRIGAQFALGAAESAALPYEIAVAPLASKEAQNVPYRETLGEDLERLMEQKASGIWDEQDQKLYESIVEQIKDPRKSEEFVQTADIGLRGLAEKATGQDLHPEGVLEKAASWAGFIKNLKKLAELTKLGYTPKNIMKAISPTGTDAMRGLGAGTALEMAEQGDFGPIGTLVAAIFGDLAGGGAAGLAKAAMTPKKSLAKLASKFTPKEKLDLQKEIIKDFRQAGLEADLGTITDSNLIKAAQARLAQSGLTGKALDQMKERITSQIKNEYKAIADTLGEYKYSTLHEAGEVAKSAMEGIRRADLAEARNLYDEARKSLKETAYVDTNRIASQIEEIEKELKPGSIKSTQQNAVLKAVEDLKKDITDANGNILFGSVRDLINNKIALNDIIDYEVQGGTKQLLKKIVAELDRAIISHGKDNPKFARSYINANRKFADHAKTFRNKRAEQLLKSPDPAQILNKMGTVQGIKDAENILKRTPEGKETLKNLKRLKFEKMLGDKLVDSTTEQVKLGTFSKALEKGKNREIVKELLGAKAFAKLEKLQKNAGKLAAAADKFYNASKSGVVAVDAAVIAKGMSAFANLLMMNPWPLMKITGSVLGIRKLAGLIADPEFLKLVEDAMLASEKGSQAQLIDSFERLRPYLIEALDISRSS